jgi:hypothetical protein
VPSNERNRPLAGFRCRDGGVASLVDPAAESHSTALTISSTTFFASPNTIIVLSM